MNKDDFFKKLYSSMDTIGANDNLDEYQLEAFTILGKELYKMKQDELKTWLYEHKKPANVKEAEKFIRECASDIGFCGSPKYFEAVEIVAAYNKSMNEPKPTSTQDDRILYWAKQLEHKSLSIHELVENAKWLLAHAGK